MKKGYWSWWKKKNADDIAWICTLAIVAFLFSGMIALLIGSLLYPIIFLPIDAILVGIIIYYSCKSSWNEYRKEHPK
jgi:uncharacterized protein with PQ loop repeat